ncbi:hypothetical protein Tco_0736705 [Tanacetum coccineum]
MNGKLYALDCRDGCRLRVYEEDTNSWKKFIDSKVHFGSSPALEAAALVPLNGKLCIIRNNMSISLVDISSPNKQVETNPHLWENIAGKGTLKESRNLEHYMNVVGTHDEYLDYFYFMMWELLDSFTLDWSLNGS